MEYISNKEIEALLAKPVKAKTPKKVTRYEIREFVGLEYSRPLGRKFRTRKTAIAIIKRLKKEGREVFMVPMEITHWS